LSQWKTRKLRKKEKNAALQAPITTFSCCEHCLANEKSQLAEQTVNDVNPLVFCSFGVSSFTFCLPAISGVVFCAKAKKNKRLERARATEKTATNLSMANC
jgi:hypothetical protein